MIEYDGLQHFKSVKCWGGDERLLEQKRIDSFKNLYCKKNFINLIRISYKDLKKINKNFLLNLIQEN